MALNVSSIINRKRQGFIVGSLRFVTQIKGRRDI
jgi:hypothetical protein